MTRLATTIGRAFGMLLDRGYEKDEAYSWVMKNDIGGGLIYLDTMPKEKV